MRCAHAFAKKETSRSGGLSFAAKKNIAWYKRKLMMQKVAYRRHCAIGTPAEKQIYAGLRWASAHRISL